MTAHRRAMLTAAALAMLTVQAVVVGGITVIAAPARASTAAPNGYGPAVPIPGSAPVAQAGAQRVGAADSNVSFAVTLPLRNSASLHAFIASVADPASPNYGRYLTPKQFTARYSPTTSQVAKVTSYLRSKGLTVSSVSGNRTVVQVTGTSAKAAQALGTSFGRYFDPKLHRHFVSNDHAVSLPSSVAADVLGVVGLDNHYLRTHAPVTPKSGAGPSGGFTPAQLKSGYDVNPLASAGYNGAGQTVGLFELDGFKQSNITAYDNQYALGSPAPTVVPIDGGNTTLGSGQVEVELDIEVVQAIAPKANIKVWEGPGTDQGVIDTYNAMAQSNTTPVNSTSWGLCEPDSTSSTMNAEDQIFQQMAAQGQSLFAASGDSAAYECGTSGQLAVDNPADDPWVSGTGGTRLVLSTGDTYSAETPWDTSSTEGGGGGVSTVFARPSYQTGAPGLPTACAKRCVPDISSDADPATGYSIYSRGAWSSFGGTSAAAPMWAGFAAIYNQDAVANGKARLGFANPALYALAKNAQPFAPFHDITTGHTSTTTNWPATAGYDLATGIGTYDAYNIARDLITGTSTQGNDFSISASPSTVSVTAGGTRTSTVSTAVTSGSAQSVSLSARGLPSGATASFNPASVQAGSSSTLTLSTASTTAAGSYPITISGTATSGSHTTTVQLTITGGSVQVVSNTGFETGAAAPWALTAGVLNNSTAEPPHAGSWDAWLDGHGTTHTDIATERITIPTGKSVALLRFYLHIDTSEITTSTQYDKLTVKIGSTTLATFSNLNEAIGYVPHSYNVSSFIGQTLTLSFSGSEDSRLQTSFVLDDITLTAK